MSLKDALHDLGILRVVNTLEEAALGYIPTLVFKGRVIYRIRAPD
jgi:hypothetical protein